jgi:hypothetical protein
MHGTSKLKSLSSLYIVSELDKGIDPTRPLLKVHSPNFDVRNPLNPGKLTS